MGPKPPILDPMGFHIRDYYKAKAEAALREAWAKQDAQGRIRPSSELLLERNIAVKRALDELDELWDSASQAAQARPTLWDHLLETHEQ